MTAVKTVIGALEEARDVLLQRINGLTSLQVQRAIEELVAQVAAVSASAAPKTAEYIVAATDATLTAERVATDTATVSWDFATAGQAKANLAISPLLGSLGAVDNTIIRTDGTGGKTAQGSLVTIGDTGIMNGAIAVGVNATADTTNRLSVNSAAVLFNHDGTTSQVKVNKAATANTASHLFQVGFSGRAEFGLIGTDDFTLKTSPDGSAFTTSLVALNASGALRVGVNLSPNADDGAALGTTALRWSDIFMATGAVLNFNNGNVTLTHSAGQLALSGSGATTFQLIGPGNDGIEIGRIDGNSSTPFIDFHSGATAVDYDVRLIASGGTGVAGGGTLTLGATGGLVANGTIATSGTAVGFVGFSATSTEAAAAAGPILLLDRNSASPADQDSLGQVLFRGRDSAGNSTDYADITARATTVNDGTETTLMFFELMQAGTLTPTLVMEGAAPPALRPSSSTPTLTLGNSSVPFANIFTTSIELGNASDTTLARAAAGDVNIEGNRIYRAGGTDVVVADGGTGVSSLTAYAVLCGGTTSTGNVQSVAALGAAGTILTSNGAGALPTFQAAGVGITAMTAQTTTSGTSFDFTSIPAGTKRITVMLDQVSLSGTDALLVQIGDSGGIETTGYLSSGLLDAAGGGSIIATSTTGFVSAFANAARVVSVAFTITRITGNSWVSHSAGMASNPAGTPESALTGGGSKTLSADLDRVRILATGANTFDAGTVNVFYE